MIWFIIATILLVLSVGCTIFSSIQHKWWGKKAREALRDKETYYFRARQRDYWEAPKIVFRFFSIAIMIVSSLFVYIPILYAQSWCGEYDKQKLLNRYEMLVELKAQNKDTTIQNNLFNDIYEYNQEVIMHRHWASSSWTNWYYCDDYSDVPLIKINK